jgi:hypothetical protein
LDIFVELARTIRKSAILRPAVESVCKSDPKHEGGTTVDTVAKTRWGSRYTCLKSLINCRRGIETTFRDTKLLRRCSNQKRIRRAKSAVESASAWDNATWILSFLAPFHHAIVSLQSDDTDLGMAFHKLVELRGHVAAAATPDPESIAELPSLLDWAQMLQTFDDRYCVARCEQCHACRRLPSSSHSQGTS